MPCVTYSSEQEAQQAMRRLHDSEINELLEQVSSLDKNGSWYVEKYLHPCKRRWWQKRRSVRLYSLYAPVNGIEWQIINFPPDEKDDWSINQDVSRSKVITYLLAYLGGWHQGQRAATQSKDAK